MAAANSPGHDDVYNPDAYNPDAYNPDAYNSDAHDSDAHHLYIDDIAAFPDDDLHFYGDGAGAFVGFDGFDALDAFDDDVARAHDEFGPASFFDHILNPAFPEGASTNTTPPPDPDTPLSPRTLTARQLPRPISIHQMPPSRSSRLPNGYVDLTGAPDPSNDPRPRKCRTPTPGPSSKRLKRDDGSAVRRRGSMSASNIDEIDLTDGADLKEILQKQRAEAIKAQQRPEEQATTFNNFTCVICMDTPTDITATSCGHLFCHTCINEALIAGENRSGAQEPKRSQCPVCRKFINRKKETDLIPLLLKMGLATQPRKKPTSPSVVVRY